MTAIGIYGSSGRMGRAIADVAEDMGAAVAGGVDAQEDCRPLAETADVLVDFSAPSALPDEPQTSAEWIALLVELAQAARLSVRSKE